MVGSLGKEAHQIGGRFSWGFSKRSPNGRLMIYEWYHKKSKVNVFLLWKGLMWGIGIPSQMKDRIFEKGILNPQFILKCNPKLNPILKVTGRYSDVNYKNPPTKLNLIESGGSFPKHGPRFQQRLVIDKRGYDYKLFPLASAMLLLCFTQIGGFMGLVKYQMTRFMQGEFSSCYPAFCVAVAAGKWEYFYAKTLKDSWNPSQDSFILVLGLVCRLLRYVNIHILYDYIDVMCVYIYWRKHCSTKTPIVKWS